jgi:hypothetical protein
MMASCPFFSNPHYKIVSIVLIPDHFDLLAGAAGMLPGMILKKCGTNP